MIQNISVDTLTRIMKKKKENKFYELVQNDRLLKLFIPLKVSHKFSTGIYDVAKHLFEKAFNIAFKCENMNIQLNDLIVRRLDDEHVVVISRYVLHWQTILDFWNVVQDVLYSTIDSNERILYNRLFYYSIWDDKEQPMLIDDQTFKYLIINGVNKKLYFKRHCMFDTHFLNKFSKKSNSSSYLKLPIYVRTSTAEKNVDEEYGKTTFVSSSSNNTQPLFFRDIIQHFHMQQHDTETLLCSDLFAAVEQTLSKKELGFMKSQWHQQPLSSFLSTGVIEIPTGNYCVFTERCNSNTHKSAVMSLGNHNDLITTN